MMTTRSALNLWCRSAEPAGELVERVGPDEVVRPQATLFVVPALRNFLRWWLSVGWLASKSGDELTDADLACVLTQHVDDLKSDQVSYVPTAVEDWDIPDPAGKSLEDVRAIRDAIDFRVRGLVDHKLELIRADKTAHRMRLERLIPPLAAEFEGLRSDAEIRTCADAILARYDEAAVRSHVLTLAHRQTRDCLRAERCDVLATA